jgi:glycosyltransferase involved in cell wall biosynthesis
MRPRVALLPWGDVFEDWLDPLGVTPEQFRDEVTGSWMFGYVDSLRAAGVDTVLVCFTSRVAEPARWVHRPTGATLHLIPLGRAFSWVSRHMLREPIGDRRTPSRVGRAALRNLAPYLATPVSTLIRLVRAEGCAAILCQEYETPRFDWAVVAGALTRLPVFASFQGGDYHVSRIEGAARRFTIGRADRLIVPTASEVERLRRRYGLADGKVERIFNPIDVGVWRQSGRAFARSRLGIADDVVLVVWHGQLQVRRKGLDLLLDAWLELTRRRPRRPLRLLLVGAGEDSAELRRRVRECGLDNVEILDQWINDRARIAEILSAGDLYVFPSRHEGFPVAPVEAMACGLSVVATDVQGIPDIFERGEADGGIVVQREDVVALTRAMGQLVDDEERRQELGRNARKRVEAAFSYSAVGRELRRVLLREVA